MSAPSAPPPNPTHPLSDELARLGTMFSERLRRFGDGPECAEHRDVDTQERRLHALCDLPGLATASVLDFGCATGHLLSVLRRDYGFVGRYTGYDVSAAMIETARAKHADARFECRDVLASGVEGRHDYVFVSGTFNDRLAGDGDANWQWMVRTLPVLFGATGRCLVFNNLSRYVDYFDEHLFYVDPMRVFGFCKEELSPLVALRHDYAMRDGVVPYEFSTYVHRGDAACRALNTAAL